MTKIITCPKCHKEVPVPEFTPDSDSIKDFLSASLDSEGNPIFNFKNLKFNKTEDEFRCYFCGEEIQIEELKSGLKPELKPAPNRAPKAAPNPAPGSTPPPAPNSEPVLQEKHNDCWRIRISDVTSSLSALNVLMRVLGMSMGDARKALSQGELTVTENQAKQIKQQLDFFAHVKISPFNSDKAVTVEDVGPAIPLIGIQMHFNDESGTLWIVGNGSLQDYIKENKKEYKELTSNPGITRIVFKGSINKIWGGIFSNKFYPKEFKNLREVILPEGLEEISVIGFDGCTKLEKVTLPDTLRKIEGGAFDNCPMLSEVCNLHPRVKYFDRVFKNNPLLRGKIPESQR